MIFEKRVSHGPSTVRWWLGLFLGVTTVLACSSQPTPPPAPAPSATLSRLPSLGLTPADDIDSVDFAVDSAGTLHVTWQAVLNKGTSGGSTSKVLYARGEKGGTVWTAPVEIDDRHGRPPRIVLTPGRLHIVQEQNFRHSVSQDDGRSWTVEAPLAAGAGKVLGLDVVSRGEGLLLASLSRSTEAGGGLELHVTDWSPSGEGSTRRVATFPASSFQQPNPRLVQDGDLLHLLCGVNVETRRIVSSGGRSAEEFVVSGRLVYLRSEDGGATWSPPAEVVPPGAAPAGIKPLEAVEILVLPGRLQVLFSAFGLSATHSEDGRAWSPPVPVAPYQVSASEGTYESGSVAAAASPGGGYLAWIDARFRKSDRSWLNPLGGAPWSDESPFWTNNDVFLLPLAELGNLSSSRPGRPGQVTPPGSFARSLRMRAGPDRVYLLWTGRKQGDKSLPTSGNEPEIVFTTLPRS